MPDRTLDELASDPVIARALQRIGQRTPQDPCPRCGDASIAPNSPHGLCQPCSTAQEERIRASRRRSYHRRKQLPTLDDTGRRKLSSAGIDPEVLVGEQGFRLLTIKEAAEVLGVSSRTIWRWIGDGTIRSLLLPPPEKRTRYVRRVPSDAIVDLLEDAERREEPTDA